MSVYPSVPSKGLNAERATHDNVPVSSNASGTAYVNFDDISKPLSAAPVGVYGAVSDLAANQPLSSSKAPKSQSNARVLCAAPARLWTYVTSSYYLFFEPFLASLGFWVIALMAVLSLVTLPLCGLGVPVFWLTLAASRWFTRVAHKSYRYVGAHVDEDIELPVVPPSGKFLDMFKDKQSWSALLHALLVRPIANWLILGPYKFLWYAAVALIASPVAVYYYTAAAKALPWSHSGWTLALVPVGLALGIAVLMVTPIISATFAWLTRSTIAFRTGEFHLTAPAGGKSRRARCCYAFSALAFAACVLCTAIMVASFTTFVFSSIRSYNCNRAGTVYSQRFTDDLAEGVYFADVHANINVIVSAATSAAYQTVNVKMAGGVQSFTDDYTTTPADPQLRSSYMRARSSSYTQWLKQSLLCMETTVNVYVNETARPRIHAEYGDVVINRGFHFPHFHDDGHHESPPTEQTLRAPESVNLRSLAVQLKRGTVSSPAIRLQEFSSIEITNEGAALINAVHSNSSFSLSINNGFAEVDHLDQAPTQAVDSALRVVTSLVVFSGALVVGDVKMPQGVVKADGAPHGIVYNNGSVSYGHLVVLQNGEDSVGEVSLTVRTGVLVYGLDQGQAQRAASEHARRWVHELKKADHADGRDHPVDYADGHDHPVDHADGHDHPVNHADGHNDRPHL